jgi:hypothetical protein
MKWSWALWARQIENEMGWRQNGRLSLVFFSFLILAVEMGWMGHYMASHLMLHLFFLFLFLFQPYILIYIL